MLLSHLFLGISLVGSEWVLYFLLLLSVFSVALMLERAQFYRRASKGLMQFRHDIRQAVSQKNWGQAAKIANARNAADLDSAMALALLSHGKSKTEVLTEIAQDPVMQRRLEWEKNLSLLATVGSNAPFIGLFGTVLGIIKAFHDLSQSQSGAATVTAGVSEALVATAIGLLVAIPAVVAYNLFQRKVKAAIAEAESLKSFLIGKLAE